MRWLNPAAFAGMVLLLVPLIAHLLTRRHARVMSFPTLRFLPRTPLVPTRVTRPTDLLLLAVRLAIIAVAVAALAQPQLFLGAAMAGNQTARVIIVDTSASMSQQVGSGTLRDSALRVARLLADSSVPGVVVATAAPHVNIGGALSWLNATAPDGRRELVVISDFQRAEYVAPDEVSPEIGLRFMAVRATPSDSVLRVTSGSYRLVQSMTDSSSMVQLSRLEEVAAHETVPVLHAAASDSELQGIRRAVQNRHLDFANSSTTPGFRITIAFPASEEHAAWQASQDTALTAQQADAIRLLRADSTLARAVRMATSQELDSASGTNGAVLARNSAGEPLFAAFPGDSMNTLRITSFAGHRTPVALALIDAATRIAASSPRAHELDPRLIDQTTLDQWSRPATDTGANGDRSDGKWLWAVVLLLLLAEWFLRRERGCPVGATNEAWKEAA